MHPYLNWIAPRWNGSKSRRTDGRRPGRQRRYASSRLHQRQRYPRLWQRHKEAAVIIKEPESHIHIDFVPMVDTLFNLLIFFLLATTLKQAEREMQIALPYAAAAGPISA